MKTIKTFTPAPPASGPIIIGPATNDNFQPPGFTQPPATPPAPAGKP
jgi:hypothetical protein